MKMLVSDYDGTFYTSEEEIKINIQQVTHFMEKHLFVIATGRSYFDFQEKKEQYHIPYHYLIINNGATILKQEQMIYNCPIDDNIKNQIIQDLKNNQIMDSFACSGIESRVSFTNDNLTKLYISFTTKEEAIKMKHFLSTKYKNHIQIFFVRHANGIEIVSKKVDKANAIAFLAQLLQIESNYIYTIGDNTNDLEMIRQFEGFTIKGSIEEVKLYAKEECDSVAQLIKKITNIC